MKCKRNETSFKGQCVPKSWIFYRIVGSKSLAMPSWGKSRYKTKAEAGRDIKKKGHQKDYGEENWDIVKDVDTYKTATRGMSKKQKEEFLSQTIGPWAED